MNPKRGQKSLMEKFEGQLKRKYGKEYDETFGEPEEILSMREILKKNKKVLTMGKN